MLPGCLEGTRTSAKCLGIAQAQNSSLERGKGVFSNKYGQLEGKQQIDIYKMR